MAQVMSVSRSAVHGFSKNVVAEVRLVAGHGVEGDAHSGAKVQHLYRKRKDPNALNLCQVHLLQQELFRELAEMGITVDAGQMGENILTSGVDLLTLPVGARVKLGESAIVEITGLRDPCSQLNRLHSGLMKACISLDEKRRKIRKAGVMGVVIAGGLVRPGDLIQIELPAEPHRVMGPV
jgi:MOSC domain-containing protein YiiM